MSPDDHLPISALSHFVYCPRRAALVHVLGLWAENVHTASGRLVHERVDDGGSTARPGLRVLRSVHVRSERLRLSGVVDAVEVYDEAKATRYVPVETKRGPRRRWHRDEVQLCAQAIALEEMTGTAVPTGAIFHARSRRRRAVSFDEPLRLATEEAARQLHALIAAAHVPAAAYDGRCVACSLSGACQPDARLSPGTLERAIAEAKR